MMYGDRERTSGGGFRSTAGKTALCCVLLLLLILAMLVSWKTGLQEISFGELFRVLDGGGGEINRKILLEIRLPRILLGALTGACLAVSGAILQGVMRNPLASPGIIGVSSGGGLGGLLAILVFPQYATLQIPAAFTGSLAAAFLIYFLAWKRETDPVRLVLAGVAVSSMLGAVSGMIMLLHAEQTGRILDFTFGSLSAGCREDMLRVLPYMVVGLAAAMTIARRIDILAMGDETATALGIKVERSRFLMIATAALLAASAVSVAGLVGFVGLIAPHVIRMIAGPVNRFLLPASGIFGAFMVVSCDLAGRYFAAPGEIPAGLVLALLGPPFFLWLLRRNVYAA